MLLKFKIFSKYLYLQPATAVRKIHKYRFRMDKAYLRKLSNNEQFQITFGLVSEQFKVNRQFNFNRKLSETVGTFLSRVATNVEKTLNKKNKKKDNENLVKVDVLLHLNGQKLSEETICSDAFQPGNKVELRLLDKNYEVVINSPWIDVIALPSSILANFPVYPSKFETVSIDKSLSEFNWYKSKDKGNWTNISNEYICIPPNDAIDHYLKLSCTPKNNQLEGPVVEVVSSCKVEASPGQCPFEIRHQFTRNKTDGKQFRVLSYNILADLYCDSDFTRESLFPYCPPYALAIDYRKQLFLKEIMGYNADIVCLQEVDRKIFKHDLLPLMSHLGYDSDFALKGAEVAEGLAFFFNSKRFKKLDSQRIVFAEHIKTDPIFADIWKKIAVNAKLSERILARTTTLQVNAVESLRHNEVLVVANVHLYFHPDADHIRLLHGGCAIKYLEQYIEKLKAQYQDKRISLVFCGDFNSVPECGIFKLYTTGQVPKDWIDYSSNQEESLNDLELKQSFKLDSACGTPKYTNYTAGFADCLDYIFYENDKLAVSQVVPFPNHEEVTQHTALPSIVFPSDHIALISDLEWL